jgi:hypothetical protein
MITPNAEYIKLIKHRLDENWRSFKILYELKHYGNCITILCQELDQVLKILFLLKRRQHEKEHLIDLTINSQKWHLQNKDNKKEYITDGILIKFAQSLEGWEKSIYEFGFSFKSLSTNYNYLLKNPIRSLKNNEREKIHSYIQEYHIRDFSIDFTLDDLIPILPMIFELVSNNLKAYIEKL